MKRFAALFLTLAMLLSLFPATVWAEQQEYTDDQVYIAEEETKSASEEEIESTPVEEVEEASIEETADSESDETVVVSETITVSAPLAYAAATTEARWGKTTGTNNDGKPTSWKSGTLTAAMTYANGLTSGTAYIQLLRDVDTNAKGALVFNKTTILDLNGYDIDRGLTAVTENGNVITVNGNLTFFHRIPP